MILSNTKPVCHILSRNDYVPRARFEVHDGTEYALYREDPNHFNDDENIIDDVLRQGIKGADPNGRTWFRIITMTLTSDSHPEALLENVYVTCIPKEMYLKNRFEGLNLIDNTADTELPFMAYYEGTEMNPGQQESMIRSCKETIIAKGAVGTDFHFMTDITYV